MEVGDPHLPLPVKVGYSRCGRLPPGLRLRGYHPLRPAIPGEFGCPGSGAYARIQNPTSPPGHPKRIRFGLLPFPSPVLGESRLISFPPPTRMFPFGGFAYAALSGVCPQPLSRGRVSPFGHPRIHGCMRLPAAFRSLPRPSSPPESSHPLRGVPRRAGSQPQSRIHLCTAHQVRPGVPT